MNWMRTPASFWIFLIISPLRPMTMPTANLGTGTCEGPKQRRREATRPQSDPPAKRKGWGVCLFQPNVRPGWRPPAGRRSRRVPPGNRRPSPGSPPAPAPSPPATRQERDIRTRQIKQRPKDAFPRGGKNLFRRVLAPELCKGLRRCGAVYRLRWAWDRLGSSSSSRRHAPAQAHVNT